MTVTVTTKTEVQISPRLKQTVWTALQAYERLKAQRTALDAELDRLKGGIEAAFEEAKEGAALDAGCAVNGYKLRVVRGVSSSFDRKRMIADGVTEELMEAWTVTKPKKPYLLVTAPGGSHDDAA